jgi:putative ABC transport system substrate-binding protein
MGIELQVLTVNEAGEIEAALESAAGQHADALLVLPDLFLTSHARMIANQATAAGLPTIADSLAWAEAGCFMAYAVSRSSMFHRAAFYVAKILGGTSPAEIPVERPSRFELILNLKTAALLGRTFPQRLLREATMVVQ